MRKAAFLICPLAIFTILLIAWPAMAMERVSGNKITFAWDPSTGAEGYILLFATYPNADYLGEIDVGNRTQMSFDISGGESCYVGVQAYNRAGRSGISNIVSFVALSESIPHPVRLNITANGSDGPLQVPSRTPISIGVNLALENYWGQNVDCWIVEQSPYGWFSYVSDLGWVSGIRPYRGKDLYSLESVEIPNSNVSDGDHIFYLAVDNNADTILDATWWDSVTVKVGNRGYTGGH